MQTMQPILAWAQRKADIYITVEVDCKEAKVEITERCVKISATSDGVDYETELPLFAEVDTETSRWTVARGIIVHLFKKEKARWPRLLETSERRKNIKVDWNRWIDTDDEEEAEKGGLPGAGGFDMSGLDFGSMGGLGGMGGMGGMGDMGDMGDFNMDDLDADESDNDEVLNSSGHAEGEDAACDDEHDHAGCAHAEKKSEKTEEGPTDASVTI